MHIPKFENVARSGQSMHLHEHRVEGSYSPRHFGHNPYACNLGTEGEHGSVVYTRNRDSRSLESSRSACNKGGADLLDTVRQGELEVGDKELLDVRAADVLRLLNLHNPENLQTTVRRVSARGKSSGRT